MPASFRKALFGQTSAADQAYEDHAVGPVGVMPVSALTATDVMPLKSAKISAY
jgi:hypothetical protein